MATVRSVTVSLNTMDRSFGRGFRNAARDVQKFQRSTDTNLSKVRASVLKVSTGLKGLTKGFTVSVKTAAAVGALSALAGAAAVSAQQILALGAAIAPLGGLLAALPGAAGLAIAAFATLKLATSNMGDAFGAALQGPKGQDKFDKALEQMGPVARTVAMEFKRLVPTLLAVRNAAQFGFWGPLHGEMTKTAKVLAGPLKTGFRNLGQELGSATRDIAQFVRESRTVDNIKAIFSNTTTAVSRLRGATKPLLGGFLDLARVGSGFLTSLTPAIAQAAAQFGRFLSAAANSGRALEWMNTGLEVLKQLGRILRNVGSIFISMFKAAGESGGGLLGTIESLTGQFAKFLKSTEGVKTLRAIFSGIGEIGKALGPVIIALGKGLGAVAPSIGRIAQVVGPVLTKAIQALAPALTKMEPGITALIVGLGGAFEAIAPALPAVAKALSDIAIAIAPVLPALGFLVAEIATGLADAITQLLPSLPMLVGAIIQIASVLTDSLLDALVAVAPYLPDMVIAVSDLLIALIPAIPALAEAAVALAPLVPVMTDAIRLLTDLTNTVMPALIWAISLNVEATKGFVAIVKWAWGLIKRVISDQIDLLKKALGWFGSLGTSFSKWFKSAKDSAVKKLGELVDWVKGLGGRIKNGIGDLGKLLYRAGQSVINGLIDGITSKFNSLKKILGNVTSVIPDWKGPLDTDKRLLMPAGAAIMGGLISGIVGQLPALRAVLGTVTTTIGAPGQPGLAVAGPGLPQPRGALRTADQQQPLNEARLAAAVGAAVAQALHGVSVQMDKREVAQIISKELGRTTQQRGRTG